VRPRLGTRTSGVLLHPTSLPGPHGSGDLGPEAHRFVDFLARARQSWWQMLPVVPPGAGDSPYQSTSAFAGSPLLISLETLARRGLLKPHELEADPRLEPGRVRYAAVRRFRERALRVRALRDVHGNVPWTAWEPELRTRKGAALARARHALASHIRYHQFVQLEFHRQWSALRRHCGERGVGLIGDLPVFVAHNSADVWAHQELFRLDRNGRPSVQAGVPPDYFSATGQLWGNPIYRWDVLRARGYDWWVARLGAELDRFDAVRLDHFIGFHNYWEVPGRARTARKGRWVLGPGAHLFEQLFRSLKRLQLIAEDLGVLTPQVEVLRDQFSLPGMKVLHFAFSPRAEASRPHHFPRNAVVYTGTHDNDTTRGWLRSLSRAQRELVLEYVDGHGRHIHWDLIRLAWLSAPHTAIVPAQDLLGLGSGARMNRPGKPSGNWAWRVSAGALGEPLAERLGELTNLYGRAVGSRR